MALAALPSANLAATRPALVVSAPASYEVSFGRVAGLAPRGTQWVVVRVGARALPARRIRGRSFDFNVSLPLRETTLRMTAVAADGSRSSARVDHVFGLPKAARPRGARAHAAGALARRVVPLVRAFQGTSAVYVEDLTDGAGAAWNARARFPAASTLKLAVAVEVLRTLSAKPAHGSPVDSLLRSMLLYSDNEAANRLEAYIGGSVHGGSARVDALLRSLGLLDSEMYGGYLREAAANGQPIPLRTDASPAFGAGKYTTARDLARLLSLVHLASDGKGLLTERYRGQLTPSDARYLLYLLAHVADPGKLDRFLPAGAAVLHKAGWISSARHDAGLVYWPGGVFVAAVMTHGGGVGIGSDLLAGRVARAALTELSARRRPATAHAPNPVVVENRRPGTADWQGTVATDGKIEAYAEPSVLPGATLHLHVSTSPAASYEIRVYRLGWYRGAGARLITTLQGTGSPQPRTAGPTGAGWPITNSLSIPADWVSGYYLARAVLTSGPQAGREARSIFVVLPPASRRSRMVVQVPVNTWQAYNPWGGKSLYDFNSPGGRASRVSFERPLSPRAQNPFEWEIQLVRFLEREGYDVSYQTDIDTERDPGSLLTHRLAIVAGHDEYWTSRMRDAFEAARDAGTNLAFLGANIGFWQVRYENGQTTIVGYKSKDDPLTSQSEQTVQFRDLTPSRPECRLLGVQEDAGVTGVGDAPRGYAVAAPDDPWFRGTGLTGSTVLDDLVGYEWDTVFPDCVAPGSVVLLHYEGKPSNADAVRYTAPSGARVFSAGSLQFTWGLDDFPSSFSGGSHPIIPGLVVFMRNALADLGRPAPPTAIRVRSSGSRLVVRVARRADPRVKEIVVRRDSTVVCRTTTGSCTLRRTRAGSHLYSAAAVDAWGASTRISTRA